MEMQCLYYALDKINSEGGYILFRKSSHWCIPHALHMDKCGKITHFIPKVELNCPWYSLYEIRGYLFGFDGYIKEYDDEECEPLSILGILLGTIALGIFGAIWLSNKSEIRKIRLQHENKLHN